MRNSKKAEADEKIRALLWYKKLKGTTNESFFYLYENEKRYLVLMGGAGSGKSIFAGRKILERVCSEEGHRILVVRKVARTLRESCFTQLCAQISDFYDPKSFKINRTELSIRCEKTGSSIIFAGLDDVEKLKSIYSITGIWIEEASEITESDFNQLDIRLRGESRYYKQIIISFNPVDVNHWLKKRFFDHKSENAEVHRSTYKDNRFLDEAARKVLEDYKNTDPYYYSVYCLGEWGVYGKTVFDSLKVNQRLNSLKNKAHEGEFLYEYDGRSIYRERFRAIDGGRVKIYAEPKAEEFFVIGADTAGEGSDYFAAQVINNETGEQAAVLHGYYDEDLFAAQLYCLGKYYNNALIGVEANFSSYPIKELERLGYKNQFVRQSEDTFTHKVVNSYGFKTTSATRPVIIADLIEEVREKPEFLNDRETLEEMLTFVRNERGRAEAQAGAHDDLVMALAIALYIRPQQKIRRENRKPKTIYNFEFEKPGKCAFGEGEKKVYI